MRREGVSLLFAQLACWGAMAAVPRPLNGALVQGGCGWPLGHALKPCGLVAHCITHFFLLLRRGHIPGLAKQWERAKPGLAKTW